MRSRIVVRKICPCMDTQLLRRGAHTFTLERLQDILANRRIPFDEETREHAQADWNLFQGARGETFELKMNYLRHNEVDGDTVALDSEGSRLPALEFCRQLYGHGCPVSIAVQDLDASFSDIFRFVFEPLDGSQMIVERASGLLERTPARPPELVDTPTVVPLEYQMSSCADGAQIHPPLWERLQVTTYVSDIVLQFALSAVMDDLYLERVGKQFLNITAALLEMVSELERSITDTKTAWRSFIVRAYLWGVWHRCQLIFFHVNSTIAMRDGSSDGKVTQLALRGSLPSPGVTLQEMSKRHAARNKSAYMCGWNVELLQNNPVCIGGDFRRFHQLYNAAFDSRPARCFPGQPYPCTGESPRNCQRFYGTAVQNQSAHDHHCSGDCKMLVWDEDSYRNLSGSRAVCLAQTLASPIISLRYCNATDRTLAISHVWSHGQGGRPESGFNQCLHSRYSDIATSLECDSYWIDAACIPFDRKLRAEAIANINPVFRHAKVMLVCDQDMMQIDISTLTHSICETLLVTTLVSDWNTRAWTFFEAFRARQNIYFLCRNNAVISLKQVLQTVCTSGALDIAIMALAIEHAIPGFDDLGFGLPIAEGGYNRFKPGYFTIERSGRFLINRPVSHPGDDIIIWSLLTDEKTVFHDAESFWKDKQIVFPNVTDASTYPYYEAAQIETGYLVSRIPRLKIKGLGWAPISPTSSFSTQAVTKGLYGFEGRASLMGFITPDGLVADWWLWKFSNVDSPHLPPSPHPRNLSTIRERCLQGYRWGAILFPIESTSEGEFHKHVDKFWEKGGYLTSGMVVVCGTNDINGSVAGKRILHRTESGKKRFVQNKNAVGWEWRGVHAWDNTEPQPAWQLVSGFWIV